MIVDECSLNVVLSMLCVEGNEDAEAGAGGAIYKKNAASGAATVDVVGAGVETEMLRLNDAQQDDAEAAGDANNVSVYTYYWIPMSPGKSRNVVSCPKISRTWKVMEIKV